MALLDNLLSYFKLDEASGNGLDAHGARVLVPTGTVGTRAGKIGNARDFNASVLYEANVLNLGDSDFSLQAWINLDGISGAVIGPIIARRGSDGNDTINYILFTTIDSTIRFVVGHTDSSQTGCVGPTLSTGTWYHVVATHDAAAEELKLYVNNGTPTTQPYSGKTVATTALDGFRIGNQYNGNASDGAIDEVGVWDRVLTAGEITDLYNSGNGLAYEDFSTAIITTPPTTALGITAYAPTATGDPTLFEYFPAASVGSAQPIASTSIAVTSTPPIGSNIALLLMAFDNSGTSADGDYSQVTGVTDDKSNTWHKLAEHSNTNGSAGAGATVSAWYCEVDPNTFESTITTATFSSSIAGRNAAMIYCRSETLSLFAAEILTSATDASTSYGSLSTSLAAKNRMYVRVCAQENETAAGFTPTTGFTTIVSSVQTASGNAMGLRAELRIATSTNETSNPSSSFSSDTASVFIALEADAAGGDAEHTAINTYSMTGVSDATDEVTQITAVSVGVNSSTTADEVTQITPISIGINVSTEDEVTQIVMYSITSQPIPVPETTVFGITSFTPSLASGAVTISPVTPPLTLTGHAPVITAEATTSVIVPTTSFGITTYEPSPPASMTVIVPTAELGIVPRVPRVLTPGTPGGDDCCCCCWEATVTVSVRFSARHSVR